MCVYFLLETQNHYVFFLSSSSPFLYISLPLLFVDVKRDRVTEHREFVFLFIDALDISVFFSS